MIKTISYYSAELDICSCKSREELLQALQSGGVNISGGASRVLNAPEYYFQGGGKCRVAIISMRALGQERAIDFGYAEKLLYRRGFSKCGPLVAPHICLNPPHDIPQERMRVWMDRVRLSGDGYFILGIGDAYAILTVDLCFPPPPTLDIEVSYAVAWSNILVEPDDLVVCQENT